MTLPLVDVDTSNPYQVTKTQWQDALSFKDVSSITRKYISGSSIKELKADFSSSMYKVMYTMTNSEISEIEEKNCFIQNEGEDFYSIYLESDGKLEFIETAEGNLKEIVCSFTTQDKLLELYSEGYFEMYGYENSYYLPDVYYVLYADYQTKDNFLLSFNEQHQLTQVVKNPNQTPTTTTEFINYNSTIVDFEIE